jgi:hypothetical protein
MKPKILVLDIEVSPIISYTWGLFDQNVALNQIRQDWHVLSWAAKWFGESRVYYADQRKAKDITDDRKILEQLKELWDEADLLLTQNGISFDVKKLKARFILNGMQPPAPVKVLDTLRIAKKHFAFTSNKLAYLSEKLCTKYKKLTHHEYEGFDLWKECMAGNKKAWNVMEKYNKHDILALEELYEKLRAWDNTNLGIYHKEACKCGSQRLQSKGVRRTVAGEYRRYQCKDCGHYLQSSINLLDKEDKKRILRSI